MKSKHVVTYIGAGIWKDKDLDLYVPNKSHEFETDKSEAEFLEERGDIKFMVEYGQMTIATASIEEAPVNDGKTSAEPPKENATVTPGKPIIK